MTQWLCWQLCLHEVHQAKLRETFSNILAKGTCSFLCTFSLSRCIARKLWHDAPGCCHISQDWASQVVPCPVIEAKCFSTEAQLVTYPWLPFTCQVGWEFGHDHSGLWGCLRTVLGCQMSTALLNLWSCEAVKLWSCEAVKLWSCAGIRGHCADYLSYGGHRAVGAELSLRVGGRIAFR